MLTSGHRPVNATISETICAWWGEITGGRRQPLLPLPLFEEFLAGQEAVLVEVKLLETGLGTGLF